VEADVEEYLAEAVYLYLKRVLDFHRYQVIFHQRRLKMTGGLVTPGQAA